MNVKKIKLLFFVSEDWYFCSHRLPLALAAKENGYNVIVVTRSREYGKQIKDLGIKVIPFEQNRGSINPFSIMFTILRLAYIYQREKPDIIHNVSIKQVIIGAVSALISRNKNIVSAITGLGWISNKDNYKSKFLEHIIKIILKILPLGQIIVQNKDDMRWVEDLGTSKFQINLIRGSGVNVDEFKPNYLNNRKNVSVVLVARMLWDKGINEFVKAAKFLKNNGIKANFILIGAPDKSNPTSIPVKQLKTWVKEGHIEWWGHKKNISSLLKKADIACLPSYREGIPKFLIEAFATALPVVTTQVPGCNELVKNNKNGFLVPPREYKHLAKSLKILIEDYDLRFKMGQINRRLALDNYSLDKINYQTLDIYSKFKN